jgi:predicted amidophosphoribosyltransferase
VVEDRMTELAVLLGHRTTPRQTSRPCARCGRHRGHGQKYCPACSEEAKREYNAEYHRTHYRRLSPDELSAVKRAIVNKRWRRANG